MTVHLRRQERRQDDVRWLTSFLTDRTQEVFYNGSSTTAQRVFFGVPQGSVLGPILFTLYTADIALVAAHNGLQLHQYADDCQLYISAAVDETLTTTARLSHCVTDVARWLKLSASRLRLNPAKTVLIWLGSRQQVETRNPAIAEGPRDAGVPVEIW